MAAPRDDVGGRRANAFAMEIKPILLPMPAPAAPNNWGMDVSLGPNSLKRRVQVIAQLDDCLEGHALTPSGAQLLNDFRKP